MIRSIRLVLSFFCVLSLLVSCGNNSYETEIPADWQIEPQYNYASSFSNGIAVVQDVNDAYMFIDLDGNTLYNRKFFEVKRPVTHEQLFDNTSPLVQDDPFRDPYFINVDGYPLPPPIYPIVEVEQYPYNYRVAVSEDNWKGLIDYQNQWVLPPEYNSIKRVADTQFQVEQNGKYGFVAEDLSVIFVDDARKIEAFDGDYALVYFDSADLSSLAPVYNYIDKEGNVLLKSHLTEKPYSLSEDVITFQKDGLWGYMSITGEVLIQPIYINAGAFSEGLAFVENSDGQAGYINKRGEIIVSIKKRGYGGAYHNGVAPFTGKNGKVRLIDRSGKWLTLSEYDTYYFDKHTNTWELTDFWGIDIYFAEEGILISGLKNVFEVLPEAIVAAKNNSKISLMDVHTGSIKTYDFEYIGPFSEGVACVKLHGAYGYIDSLGNWIYTPQFDKATEFSDGVAAVASGGKWGYVSNPIISDAPSLS